MWRREGAVATLLLLRKDDSLAPRKKYERSKLSLNERPVRILSGRSLSERDSLTLVSDSSHYYLLKFLYIYVELYH